MNKQIPLILFLIVICAVVYVGITEGFTQHYDDGEISFDYPLYWSIIPSANPSQVVLFKPLPTSTVTVNKQVIPPGYRSPDDYVLNSTAAYDSGFRLVSHDVKNLSADTAYENTYYFAGNKTYLQKEVWIPKNGNLYTVIFTQELSQDISFNPVHVDYLDPGSVVEGLFATHGLEIITRNFQVKSTVVPPKTPFWGNLSIPALDVDWGIRSDSVNRYSSVFHYAESFYPGENGTVGLLGHRTIYSAPFKHVDQLKVGDVVVINDYLTQKKYIYEVVSNGDIKGDYQTNPIKFPQGNDNLTLVTCHPPGTIESAWLVHCKLSSIEPLL